MALVEREEQGIVYFTPPVQGVVFTTRLGGQSHAPYKSLNLGYLTGDRRGDVAANRAKLSSILGISPRWLTGLQVHDSRVLVGGSAEAGGLPPRPAADAVVTNEPGVPVAVLAADCVPIALIGAGGVGAVHAGWRGMCAGVIANAAAKAGPQSTAVIGPSIGPCHYVVGPDLVVAFRAAHPNAPDFTGGTAGRLRFDLRAAAIWLLSSAGASVEEDSAPPCTVCDRRFYSYRRDGRTGRQAVVVWKAQG